MKKILIICKNLKLLGYKTAQAFDGPEALGLAEKENFDLVLLDVMLPGMSGFQVKTRLAKTKRKVRQLIEKQKKNE